MEKKICNKCHEEKVITEFPFKNKVKNLRHGACVECWKEIRRISYNKNKKTTLDRNKRNNKKTLDWYKNYKSTLKCNKCGESHIACLDFHHIDPKEKDFSVSTRLTSTYSIEKIKEEINKCIVLCSNCHRIHHYEENNK